jgi:cytochrome c553
MTERGQSGARPSRVMNKRLRDMQNDVADMNAYIHAPTPKKGKPSSFLDCLPSDIMHGVMQIMSGGSL